MQSHCRGQRPYHFFKVVLPSNANDKKLKIPPKFVSIFRDELTAAATLTTPTGHIWPVRLEKASVNNCWFCDGWQEFVEHHSILAGYFLVFEYEGNSNFRVSIFDLTTCEISYPCNPSNGSAKQSDGKKSSVHPQEEMEDGISVEILGSSPPFQAPTSLKEKQTHSRNRSAKQSHGKKSTFHPEEEMEDDVSVEILGSSPPFQAPTYLKEKQIHSRCSNPLKLQKSAKTSFKSGLGIKKHGRNGDSFQSPKSKHVCFRESEKYKLDSLRLNHNQTESDEDDSLIEHGKEAKTEATTLSPKRCGRPKGREKILHAASMFKPANPSFSVTMRPYNIESKFLNVPAAFAREYLRSKSIQLRDSAGRQWPLKCRYHQRGSAKLTKGWNDFVEEKNLKEGDVCFFELIQRKDPVLKVSIFQ